MAAEKGDEAIEIIEKLIESCRDGQEGFLDAVEHTRNSELRAFFSHQALERSKFARELEEVARQLRLEDSRHGLGVVGGLRWLDLRSKLGSNDSRVLESVESEEHDARDHYQEALNAGLPAEVQSVIRRQAESVFAFHDEIRTLQNVYKKAA